jgi:RHS repeat-associated protein
MSQEQFGTQTPLYNKHFYNVRGQLSEIRVSTYSITTPGQETNWNRGALISRYSWQSWSGSGTDNNGHLKMQMIYIPNDDQISGYQMNALTYTYDGLNRLDKVEEHADASVFSWRQDYDYDRWGNRTIIAANTTAGIPKPQFTVGTGTNRLSVPAGQYGVMNYDQAGNLTEDTYTGQGQRKYDAWNRMTQAWANNQWQTYTYDGNGRRVKRNVNGAETWQIYGSSGELLAEYAANASPSQPKREFGYRSGQLLVAASGQNCGVGYQGTKTWGATNPSLGHNTGQQQGSDWVATAGTHAAGYMSYGPYDNSFGQGHHTAQFLLQVNNVSGSDIVATLDVVTAYGGIVLAQRQIRRNEFTAANQWQWFTLEFDNPCFGLVEARIYWHGGTTLKLNQVTITGINSAGGTVNWLIADQLGTPRMIADKTGSLAGMSRHDYFPFGEEIFAATGTRTTTQGYNQSDGVRQSFTGYERDDETGLDYAQARYYASAQGRFTSVDPVSGFVDIPQSWNGYTYTLNNPVNLTDPTGMVASAEQSGPSWEVEGYADYWKKRALWTDETARALAAYDQMVKTGLANLKQKQQEKKQRQQTASPRTSNVQTPTTATVKIGDPQTVRNKEVLNSKGLVYLTGIEADYAITFYDQDGNVMGPDSGITIQETVTQIGGEAQTIYQNPDPVQPDSDGVIHDAFGPVWQSNAR